MRRATSTGTALANQGLPWRRMRQRDPPSHIGVCCKSLRPGPVVDTRGAIGQVFHSEAVQVQLEICNVVLVQGQVGHLEKEFLLKGS